MWTFVYSFFGLAFVTTFLTAIIAYAVSRHDPGSTEYRNINIETKLHNIDERISFIVPGAPYEFPNPPPEGQLLANRKWSESLTELIQDDLRELQNPASCERRGFVFCETPKDIRCFFVCQLRFIANCLLTAVATKRTMIVREKSPVFQLEPIWGHQMLDLNSQCQPSSLPTEWPRNGKVDDKVMLVRVPTVDADDPKPDFLPPVVPTEIIGQLANFTEAPAAWWAGQFMLYVNKLSPQMMDSVNTERNRFNLTGPIVGIAVSLYSIMEPYRYHTIMDIEVYMKHVIDYYNHLENLGIFVEKRKVFVATENSPFILDLEEEYGDEYEFISLMESTDSEKNLTREIVELQIMSEVDYIICQFSNMVCQTAYELMLLKYPERGRHVASTLDIYRYAYGRPSLAYAIADHEPTDPKELALEKGDRISLFTSLIDGELHGKNLRTSERGILTLEKISAEIPNVKFIDV